MDEGRKLLAVFCLGLWIKLFWRVIDTDWDAIVDCKKNLKKMKEEKKAQISVERKKKED